jgi:hypothetical protein
MLSPRVSREVFRRDIQQNTTITLLQQGSQNTLFENTLKRIKIEHYIWWNKTFIWICFVYRRYIICYLLCNCLGTISDYFFSNTHPMYRYYTLTWMQHFYNFFHTMPFHYVLHTYLTYYRYNLACCNH